MPRTGPLAPEAEPHVFTIAELNRTVRDVLDGAFGPVWVEGELSNVARPASGHLYFSLKDADAQVRCAMFRGRNRLLDFAPEAGMLVRARARVGLYEARGEYQLVVEQMEPSGAGALARAFEASKKRLAAEGLFAAEHKRALPTLPAGIGVVTSATGAAVRDVLHVLARRFPAMPVTVYPVPVQGTAAAPAIARMLEIAGRRAECGLLLLVRGGGSLEDLWSFNEEAVARAIRACPIPVVSGVGHEVDVTIADLAADRRAPTPSAAAELAVADRLGLGRNVDGLERRLRNAGRALLRQSREHHHTLVGRLYRQHPERRLQQLQQRRDELAERLHRHGREIRTWRAARLERLRARLRYQNPAQRVGHLRERLARADRGLQAAFATTLRAREARVSALARALDAVSPLATLDRGYALVHRRDDHRPVTDASQTGIGDALAIRLARGRLLARVEDNRPRDTASR